MVAKVKVPIFYYGPFSMPCQHILSLLYPVSGCL